MRAAGRTLRGEMRAILVLAVCGCNSGTPRRSPDPPPPAAPAAEPAPAGIVRHTIAVGGSSACAIEATGRAACWGQSGARRADPAPVEVPRLDDVVGVVAGAHAMCAWTARGTAACWGPDPKDRFAPSFDDIVQVSISGGVVCG